ncbi:DUF6143 family protein [Lysinibacillus sp. MHQ-1]|nr:DUF6143 family protein [Lysinibacillus sp. MHQ-1]
MKRFVSDKEKNAWGSLSNPHHSNVDLFVNAFTITNHSNQPFVAEIWFNAIPPGNPMVSKKCDTFKHSHFSTSKA